MSATINSRSSRIMGILTALLCCLFIAVTPMRALAAPAEGATVEHSGTSGTVTWEIYSDGTMVLIPTSGDEGTMASLSGSSTGAPWRNYGSSIKKVETQGMIHLGSNAAYMFNGMSNCTEMDLSGFDTGNVTNMKSMFSGCSGLTSLDVSGFDTGSVTNMSYMFDSCSSLTSLDVSGFDTSNVTNMQNMFNSCSSLTVLDVNGLDTSSVTNMSYMFNSCSSLTSLDVSGFDTSKAVNMYSMFQNCSGLTSVDVSGFDTGSATNMKSMFGGCSGLTSIDVSGFDTGSATNMSYIFAGCSKLTSLDVGGFDTGDVTSMQSMFSSCSGLTSLDVSGFDTGSVTNMSSMFDGCKGLTSLDVSGFDTGNVTNMGNMFNGCSGLTTLDVSGFDTGNVTNMSYMFYDSAIMNLGDLSGWNTSKVTDMSYMFKSSAATSLDLSGWDTSNVTNMTNMFYNSKATSLDLSGWDTSNVTNISYMFPSSKVEEITLGEHFNFKGKNTTSTNRQALLPAPPAPATTGKWIREDGTVDAKTPEELRDNYDANAAVWAGKWVWDVRSDYAVVRFDTRGGYTAQTQVAVNPIVPVTVPEASRPAYILTGWNTAADGSGTSYQPGDTFTPEGGKMTTLYAQWEQAAQYTVKHYQQNTQLSGYDLAETETFYGPKNGQVTPEVKTYENFKSPSAQTVTVAEDNSTVVEYHYDRVTYTIAFNGNGATSGSVEDQHMIGGITQRLHDNKFKKDNAVFNGWNTKADGTGTAYGDAQTVSGLAGDGETFTLYAQWIDLTDSERETTEGRVTVRLRPGQKVSLPDLPAGTRYTVREVDTPDGWSQSGEVGTDGNITANGTSGAEITNRYSASGYASVYAYKTMQTGDLEEGQFSFQLLKDGNVIQTAVNGTVDTAEEILGEDGETVVKNPYYGMSIVRFEDFIITQPGTQTFQIKEVIGGEEDIEYDTHVETVTIQAVDNGDGTLKCTAVYDNDGPVFTNSRIPVFDEAAGGGRLLIKKVVSNMTTSQSFPFTVTLFDKNGTELTGQAFKCDTVATGNEDAYLTTEEMTVSAVSHTQNLDDLGEKQSDYGNGWNNSSIRGTGRDSASN